LALTPVLEEARQKFFAVVKDHGLQSEEVEVTIGTLSAEQAIGSPSRQDFALLEGREVMIEAQFKGSFGQAFTEHPQGFKGSLSQVQDLSLATASNRAIFISTLNAVSAHLDMVTGVRHCRDGEPERCGSQVALCLQQSFGNIEVGLIGFQPAIMENLIERFGVHNVQCSDLNPRNIGSHKFGVEIKDGRIKNLDVIRWCNLLLVTSSAIINNTFDALRNETLSQGKPVIMYGVSGAGVSALLGLDRVCPLAH